MSYDPEARETSNSALIIAIMAMVLIIGAGLAYYATRPTETIVPSPVVVHDQLPPAPNVVAPVAPPVTIEVPSPATHTTIERHTTTTTVPVPGVPPRDSRPVENNTNVTVNPPSPSAAAPGAAPEGKAAPGSQTGSTSSSNAVTNSSPGY